MPMTQTAFHHATPVYEELDGWWEDISKARTDDELPGERPALHRAARGALRHPGQRGRRRPRPRGERHPPPPPLTPRPPSGSIHRVAGACLRVHRRGRGHARLGSTGGVARRIGGVRVLLMGRAGASMRSRWARRRPRRRAADRRPRQPGHRRRRRPARRRPADPHGGRRARRRGRRRPRRGRAGGAAGRRGRRRRPAPRASPCFGPSAAAARLEGSKAFAKDVMTAARRADRPRVRLHRRRARSRRRWTSSARRTW